MMDLTREDLIDGERFAALADFRYARDDAKLAEFLRARAAETPNLRLGLRYGEVILYSDTHTLAEGAGAAAFAALMQERATMQGKRVAVVVSGQNIDRPWMQAVLGGATPQVA